MAASLVLLRLLAILVTLGRLIIFLVELDDQMDINIDLTEENSVFYRFGHGVALFIKNRIFFTWGVNAQTVAECVQSLTQAQIQWNQIANISNTALNWNNAIALRAALEGAFALGDNKVGTFKQVCRGHKQYKSHLDKWYSYNGCLTSRVLIADDSGKATNISEHDANVYFSIIYSFDFICGAGYPIFTNNAECMGTQIFNYNRGAIESVFHSFWYAVEEIYHQDGRFNPANAQVYCSELDIAANGDVTKQLFAVCGKPEVTFFGCEYFRQSLATYRFPYCTSIDCSVTGY